MQLLLLLIDNLQVTVKMSDKGHYEEFVKVNGWGGKAFVDVCG